MRDIGRTNDGKHLTEMTEEEHRIFEKLSIVTQGILFRGDWAISRRGIDINIEGALATILEFVETRDKINELRESVSELENIIGAEKVEAIR